MFFYCYFLFSLLYLSFSGSNFHFSFDGLILSFFNSCWWSFRSSLFFNWVFLSSNFFYLWISFLNIFSCNFFSFFWSNTFSFQFLNLSIFGGCFCGFLWSNSFSF